MSLEFFWFVDGVFPRELVFCLHSQKNHVSRASAEGVEGSVNAVCYRPELKQCQGGIVAIHTLNLEFESACRNAESQSIKLLENGNQVKGIWLETLFVARKKTYSMLKAELTFQLATILRRHLDLDDSANALETHL